MTLEEVLVEFTNDENWNTKNKDGSHRFEQKIKWIESLVKSYATYFKLSEDEVITIMENNRTYSWPNYYQEANFIEVDKFDKLIGIYKTFDEFNEYSEKHFKGFKCPRCKTIGTHPQLCKHRLEKDKICDWTAYGLFESPNGIIILENGFEKVPIFEPIYKETNTN